MNSNTLNDISRRRAASSSELSLPPDVMVDDTYPSFSAPKPETPKTTLIVEDDEGDALLVERALKSCSSAFDVHIVMSLSDAAVYLQDVRVALILLDLSLPDSHGLEGVTRLRAHAPQTPIVVLTGLDDNQLALQALDMGAQDYLVKGEWSQESLARTLRYAIQRQHVLAENERLMAEIQRQACFDALTGVLNRHSFDAELDKEWARSKRKPAPFSCVMIDVDFFKAVNDTHGHAVGDDVLRVVGKLIQQQCRASDTVGRYGGEEFCVLLPDTDEQDGVTWAERLRKSIEQHHFVAHHSKLAVTASLGVAQRLPGTKGPAEIVELADQALLRAKRSGRNRVCRFHFPTGTTMHGNWVAEQLAGLQARDIMVPIHDALRTTATLSDVAQYMMESGLEAAPVVDDHNDIAGVINENDLIREVSSPLGWDTSVSDVMSTRPVCLPCEVLAKDVLAHLQRGSIPYVFLLKDKRVVGSVSRAHVVRHLYNRRRAQATTIRTC